MKVTIEFDDKEHAMLALKGADLRWDLEEFDNWLRSQIKHGDKDWQDVRDKLWATIDMV